jgi:hypothetical protein
MRIHNATSEQPALDKVETGVLYACKNAYYLNGLYRFHVFGKFLFNDIRIPDGGFFHGTGEVLIQIPQGSSIVFDRYPTPLAKRPSPPPVDSVSGSVTPEQMVMEKLRNLEERFHDMRKTTPDEDLMQDLQDMEQDDSLDIDDLYVSDLYIEEDETLSSLQTASDSEDSPRVGEIPTKEGEGEPPPDNNENAQQSETS